ncbi:amino acid permease [bacterium]|nr:amino acid permease [bacterium]
MRKKPIEVILAQADSGEKGLKRTLTTLNIVLLGIGGIIGAGIFVLTGQAAASYAGPAIAISFILSGVGCAFAALCYAEFAAMIPVAGSAYTYAYATLGELIAWIIGWDLILEYLFGGATVAVGWSGYVVSFLADLGITFPAALAKSPFSYDPKTGWSSTGSLINLPAVLIVAACTWLLIRGIRESATFNNIVVFIKVAVILAFIIFGFSYVNMDNLTPYIPENTGKFGEYGWSGIFRGAAVIFFAYIGFDSVSTLAQEAKDPQKSMPIGIIGSLVICTIIYLLVAFVMTGIVAYPKLNDPAPIAVAINAAGDGLYWLRFPIKIGAIAGLSSVVLVLLLAQPRIFYSMANDGLLPQVFCKIHPKFGTPYVGTTLTGVLAAVVAGFFPIGILGELVSIGTLLAFVLVCAGIIILRKTDPGAHRPFRCPAVPLVPILGVLVAAAQMLALPHDTWLRLIIWMAIGFAIYFGYGKKHSKYQN